MTRFAATALTDWAAALLQALAMPADKARAVAEILVEGDLLGHDTHGLQLLATYLAEVDAGSMATDGEPAVLSDRPAVQAWDGRRLPGPWLVQRAIAWAGGRARQFGTGTVNIRRSHHIAALAPYARRVAEDGLVLLLATSSPAAGSVAPFGGTRGVFSPSPIGAGIPTRGDPVLVDVSTSITTNGLCGLLARQGARLPGAWVQDEQGRATDDPAVVQPPRQGSLLPLGGTDSGHKGTSLAWVVEALTGGLAGHGRDDPGPRWGGSIFVQVLDPAAFNGGAAFASAMDVVAQASLNNPPADPERPVRLPGQRGLALRAQRLQQGLALKPGVRAALEPWCRRLGVPEPAPLAE